MEKRATIVVTCYLNIQSRLRTLEEVALGLRALEFWC